MKKDIDFIKRGRRKYRLYDYRGAIEDCNKAMQSDPGDPEAYCLRGQAKYKLKDYAGALGDHTNALDGYIAYLAGLIFNRVYMMYLDHGLGKSSMHFLKYKLSQFLPPFRSEDP